MTEEEKQQLLEGMANAHFNSFNVNAVFQAVKHYAIYLANQSYDSMDEDARLAALTKVKEAAEQNAKAKDEAEQSSEAEANKDIALEPETAS